MTASEYTKPSGRGLIPVKIEKELEKVQFPSNVSIDPEKSLTPFHPSPCKARGTAHVEPLLLILDEFAPRLGQILTFVMWLEKYKRWAVKSSFETINIVNIARSREPEKDAHEENTRAVYKRVTVWMYL